MNQEIRSKYATYISAAIRYIQKESGLVLPEDTILITKSYTGLYEIDDMIGLKVFVCDIPSAFDFYIAFPSENMQYYKMQRYFQEYLDSYPFDIDEA